MSRVYALRCQRCGQVFEASRLDARYCSGVCRTLAHRDKRVVEEAGQTAHTAVQALLTEWAKPPRKPEAERWLKKIMTLLQDRLTGVKQDDT